ncbi:hypothetical protein PAF15_04020 [Weissella koreensis]|uniref:Uncharacterized protein n=1 Tax=Weissella koreensis TaxID=165096 RepID=A0A7H1MM12_9LACO|nr:hypothetical protein [Weissella koreensis]AEJ23672.1 hypothetical protein WKK_03990 [Weissella koreensis KACC 15510]AVH75296.1 hypothetical protein C4597_04365 [Weissella koreensis]EJF33330.1 hypothetical protein JC2156_10810 [Weissella koreensis KCTC 3621]MCZ9311140.1 hypothetical protein [Weissella koreensis]QGN20520.1 hypothetical protein GKC51_04345 [Weissella koreensis]
MVTQNFKKIKMVGLDQHGDKITRYWIVRSNVSEHQIRELAKVFLEIGLEESLFEIKTIDTTTLSLV